jgi:hypothetical protein
MEKVGLRHEKVNLMRHTGDRTIQDMIDYLGPEPSSAHAPSWVRSLGTWDWAVFPGETVVWEGDLEPGTHTVICAIVSPFGVWFGTGLIVED